MNARKELSNCMRRYADTPLAALELFKIKQGIEDIANEYAEQAEYPATCQIGDDIHQVATKAQMKRLIARYLSEKWKHTQAYGCYCSEKYKLNQFEQEKDGQLSRLLKEASDVVNDDGIWLIEFNRDVADDETGK